MLSGKDTRPRILLLVSSDQQKFKDHVSNLEMFGEFQIQGIAAWQQAAGKLERFNVDAILIDYALCEAGGAAAFKYLRRFDRSIPIIVFAGRYSKAELLLCLHAGANEYIAAREDPVIVSAKIRAHIRARARDGHYRAKIGKFWFLRDQNALLADKDGKRIPLTVRETNLLSFLLRQPNKTVETERIYRELWGYRSTITSHTVQTHVYRLRQKIEPDPGKPSILVSDRTGYCLAVDAEHDVNTDVGL